MINTILEEDKNSPVKQRHTAKRIFDRMRQEYAYTGGYTIVKDYVRLQQVRTREMFVPLTHAPVFFTSASCRSRAGRTFSL